MYQKDSCTLDKYNSISTSEKDKTSYVIRLDILLKRLELFGFIEMVIK